MIEDNEIFLTGTTMKFLWTQTRELFLKTNERLPEILCICYISNYIIHNGLGIIGV